MSIRVLPLNKTVTSASSHNLLDILLENDIPISYSCMSGGCGTCRCKVIEGHVSGPAAPYGHLSKSEKYVLACQSIVDGDCTIEIPDVDEVVTHTTKTIKSIVTSFDILTPDIRLLRLKPNKPLEFSPGQYALLTFWDADSTRAYSMAGLPEEDELEFHIRLVPNGRVTSRLDQEIKPGNLVKVHGPLGASYLRTKHTGAMLCVAGGTGLAPIYSIIRGTLESGMKNDIQLIYGASKEVDLYGLNYLRTLADKYSNFNYVITLIHSPDPKLYSPGLVTDAIVSKFPNLEGWRVYLAGSPPMVEASLQACIRRGASFDHIYADAFYPSGV